MPTAYGVAFGCICLLLFGIGFASTNNAVYFLCFFMAALGSQSLILTNRNIDKLQILQLSIEDFFADEVGALKLLVYNSTQEDMENILFEVAPEGQFLLDKLKAGERREVLVPFKMNNEGVHQVPSLKISSEFPYHFSRSWKKHYHEIKAFVYPARLGSAQFASAAHTQRFQESQSLDDFKGHREYQKSDSPRSIDWRVTARVQKVMTKEFDPQSSRKLTLRWEDCPQTSEQEKKRQLSLWLDLAEKNNMEYALDLPTRQLPYGRGPQHKTECLRSLL
ncbi:DUF58 domain-containing protein [Bdellovibrio sp. HCB337]|uniref:DUF58 domain-containing protein n=1 Tax=Bdellovibrio sp. HCB337 TaxID=3394358 RepID=UPI0039A48DA2